MPDPKRLPDEAAERLRRDLAVQGEAPDEPVGDGQRGPHRDTDQATHDKPDGKTVPADPARKG